MAVSRVSFRNIAKGLGLAYGAYAGRKGAKTQRTKPRSWTGYDKKKKGTAKSGVTSQRDSTNIYKRKTMPRRKRQKWRSFVKKVKAATTDNGNISFVYNGTLGQITNNVVGGTKQQGLAAFHLYGRNATGKANNEVGGLDMLQIVTDLRNSTEDPILTSTKIQFTSAVLDITFTNISDNTQYEGALEVDVYHIAYPMKKEYVVNGLIAALNAGSIQTSQLQTTIPKVTINQRGVTPFGIGQAVSVSGLKILRKTKYFVPRGDSFTSQIRDPFNRTIDNERLVDKACFYIPGWTQTLFIIAKPADLIADDATFSFTVGATRSYNVTYEGLHEDKSRYLNDYL